MAHFAEIDQNNVVTRVIVVNDADTSDDSNVESEDIGIAFLKSKYGSDTNWKQTSFNGNIRTRYAGINFTYNESLDAFIPEQIYPSWTINTTTKDWEAPITKPTLTADEEAAGKFYDWDEDAYQADNTTGWILHTSG